jgi:RNA polymerase sigma factor (sigma-70 family)
MSYSTTGNPEVANLFRQAQTGDSASLASLMDQHDGLVHHILRRQWCSSLSYTDVLQEGRIGLWRAILGFDPARGVSFSTYACLAIARHIWRAVSRQQAQDDAQAAREEENQKYGPAPVLLPDPWLCLVAQEVQEALLAQVVALPARQRQVVQAYYGLDGQGSRTLTQVGRELGCSRQGATYHYRRALVRLRHPAFSASLRALLGRNRRQDYLQALQPRRRRT